MIKYANKKVVCDMFVALEKSAHIREMEKQAWWQSMKDTASKWWDNTKGALSNARDAAGNFIATGAAKAGAGIADMVGLDGTAKNLRQDADQKWNAMKQHGQNAAVNAYNGGLYGAATLAGTTLPGMIAHQIRGSYFMGNNNNNNQQAAPAPAAAPVSTTPQQTPAPTQQQTPAPTRQQTPALTPRQTPAPAPAAAPVRPTQAPAQQQRR